MQDGTVRALLAEAGLEEGAGKEAVRVSLRCREEDLHRYMDMAALNHVSVKEMAAKETEEGMAAELLLKGNVRQEGMRRLLCKLAKEAGTVKGLSLRGGC